MKFTKKQINQNTKVESKPVRNNFLYYCTVGGYQFQGPTGGMLVFRNGYDEGQLSDCIQNKEDFCDAIYDFLNSDIRSS